MPADVRENPPAVGTPLQLRAERRFGTIAQDRSRQTVIFTTSQIASLLFGHVVKIQTRIVDAPRLFAFPAGEGNIPPVGGPAHDLLRPLGKARDRLRLAALDVDPQQFVFPPGQQRLAAEIDGHDQLGRVRGPVEFERWGSFATQQAMRAGRHVNNVELKSLPAEIPVAVQAVEEVVDHVGRRAGPAFLRSFFASDVRSAGVSR